MLDSDGVVKRNIANLAELDDETSDHCPRMPSVAGHFRKWVRVDLRRRTQRPQSLPPNLSLRSPRSLRFTLFSYLSCAVDQVDLHPQRIPR